MLTVLAHVTPTEFPYGVTLFFVGWATGIASATVYLRYFRSRS